MNYNIDKLKKGVYIENKDFLLQWRSTFRQLQTIDKPDIYNTSGRFIIRWSNVKILNGLLCNLETLFDEQTDYLGYLEYITNKDQIQEFNRISEHLRSNIGEPNEKIDTSDYDKFWKWEFDEIPNVAITISIYEMHDCYFSMNIFDKSAIHL